METRLIYFFGLIVLVSAQGCASSNYRFAKSPDQLKPPFRNPITVGGEHPNLDKLESVVHYPAKKFRQWFPPKTKPLEPEIARQIAVESAQVYLACNDLDDIQIDIREYNPSEQWRRLQANRRIHPFWKYTGGVMGQIHYTLVPSRVTHMDSYNPFTNTLSIASTKPTSALYQAATAKVLHSKEHPGAFATSCYLPLVPLYRDYQAANDVLSYSRACGDWQTERRLYPEIYGRFGADIISEATSLIPGMAYMPYYFRPLLSLGGRAAGTTTGKVMQNLRQTEVEAIETTASELQPIQSGIR